MQAKLLLVRSGAVAPVPAVVPYNISTRHSPRVGSSSSQISRSSKPQRRSGSISRRSEWVVFAKHPFAGPEEVLSYLARYTHRVSRLISLSNGRVSFRWKDYRQDGTGKVMTLQAGEFVRR